MTALTDKTYTQTFGALGFFWAGNAGRTAPIVGRVARYQRDAIPYGDNAVIQKSGADYAPISRQAVIKSTDLASWLAAVNTSATLTITGNSARTAYFAGFTDGELYPDGVGGIICTLNFVF